VLELAPGASSPTVLPFTGLDTPRGVAVDTAGDLYVTDSADTVEQRRNRGNTDRVWKLSARASTPTQLPFPDLRAPAGVAVGTEGSVYVTAYYSKVLKLVTQ
jgi:serine/threonine-protein kinase